MIMAAVALSTSQARIQSGPLTSVADARPFSGSHRVARPAGLLVLPPSLPDPQLLRLLSLESTPSPAQVPVLFSPAGLPIRPIAPTPATPDYFNFAAAVRNDAGYFDVCSTKQIICQDANLPESAGYVSSETADMPFSKTRTHVPTALLLTRDHLLALNTNRNIDVPVLKDVDSFSSESSGSTSWYFSSASISPCMNNDEQHDLSQPPAQDPQISIDQESDCATKRVSEIQREKDTPSCTNDANTQEELSLSQRPSTRARTQSQTKKRKIGGEELQQTARLPKVAPAAPAQAETEEPPAHWSNASNRGRTLGAPPAAEAFATSLQQLENHGGRPAYLWWTLIRAAILGAPGASLQMETLCQQIADRFPYVATIDDE